MRASFIMSKYCEESREVADDMEKAKVGRKRKATSIEMELSTSTSGQQLKTQRLAVVVTPEINSTAPPSSSGELSCERRMMISSSDLALASCCSSNGSISELANSSSKFADLEIQDDDDENEVITEVSATSAGHSVDFRDMTICRQETTSLSEVHAELGELESTAGRRGSIYRRSCSTAAAIMPSADELEEFFAVAEKNMQKQFTDKYNYDIVKDEPVEGRYEWIRIQTKP